MDLGSALSRVEELHLIHRDMHEPLDARINRVDPPVSKRKRETVHGDTCQDPPASRLDGGHYGVGRITDRGRRNGLRVAWRLWRLQVAYPRERPHDTR